MKTMIDIMSEKGMMFKNHKGRISTEIEAEFITAPVLDGIPPAFTPVADGSLLHNGVEYITRRPTSVIGIKKDIAELYSTPRFREDYLPSTRTSTHFHVNIQHLTKDQLITVLLAYYSIEPLLFNFVGKTREDNLFCLPLYSATGGLRAVKMIIEDQYNDLYKSFQKFKYAALNVANVARLGTIEFRHMYGTFDEKVLFDWIDIIDNITSIFNHYETPEALWADYQEDRAKLCAKILGQTKVEIPYDFRFVTDANYSSMWEIMDYPNVLEQRKSSRKQTYKFFSERDIDLGLDIRF